MAGIEFAPTLTLPSSLNKSSRWMPIRIPTKLPPIIINASLKSTSPNCQYRNIAENDVPAVRERLLPIQIGKGMPKKMLRIGVSNGPPPMPKKPDRKPVIQPRLINSKILTAIPLMLISIYAMNSDMIINLVGRSLISLDTPLIAGENPVDEGPPAYRE